MREPEIVTAIERHGVTACSLSVSVAEESSPILVLTSRPLASKNKVVGHQAGAELGYNPHKPGRPSHAIYTYWIGNLRLVLDAQLDSGKRHAPSHSRPGLVALLESLAADSRPQLVRGDVAFGSEGRWRRWRHWSSPICSSCAKAQG